MVLINTQQTVVLCFVHFFFTCWHVGFCDWKLLLILPSPGDTHKIVTQRLIINYNCLVDGSGLLLNSSYIQINQFLVILYQHMAHDLPVISGIWSLTPSVAVDVFLDPSFFLSAFSSAFLPKYILSCHRPIHIYLSINKNNAYSPHTEGHATSVSEQERLSHLIPHFSTQDSAWPSVLT